MSLVQFFGLIIEAAKNKWQITLKGPPWALRRIFEIASNIISAKI